MLDLGFDKLALISVVALVVLGPEKLPRVARTVGTLLGKAQRYVADVKSEVNRSIELEDLKKMKEQMEAAARDVESSVQAGVNQAQGELNSANEYLNNLQADYYDDNPPEPGVIAFRDEISFPEYKHPNKKWRTKRSAVPAWYKARSGSRTRALSGAARVARFRPPKPL